MNPPQRASQVGIHSIGIYKICKGLLFIALAAGLFSISKVDPDDLEDILTGYLHIDTENRLWIYLSNLLGALTDTKVKLFGFGFVLLSILNFAQAVGLILQQKWAAVLVVLEDLIFIPFEIYQLWKKVTLKICIVLAVNVVIAVYLLKHWFLFRDSAKTSS